MARSFREAGHLPKRRADGRAPDPAGLPRQRRGITPQMHGRFPDYDVMANAGHWDPVTRDLIERRVAATPALRFFTPESARVLRAFLDVVLAQDGEPRIPVLEMIDARLHAGELDGYRFADMPADTDTWRLVAEGLDEAGFVAAPADARSDIVAAFAAGELSGGAWERVNVARAWSVVMRYALAAFYAHPWAWNEIGFGGPAYPRGYMRRNIGPAGREPGEPLEAFTVDAVDDADGRGRG